MTDAEAVRELIERHGLTPGTLVDILARVENAQTLRRACRVELALHLSKHRITAHSISEEWHYPVQSDY